MQNDLPQQTSSSVSTVQSNRHHDLENNLQWNLNIKTSHGTEQSGIDVEMVLILKLFYM